MSVTLRIGYCAGSEGVASYEHREDILRFPEYSIRVHIQGRAVLWEELAVILCLLLQTHISIRLFILPICQHPLANGHTD